MKSTMTVVALLASAATLSAAPASGQSTAAQAAPEQAQPNPNALKVHSPKISSGAAKAITALQKAVEAKDAAAIAPALEAARAAAKTVDDRYAIATLQLKAAADAKDEAGIAAGLEAVLASGGATEEEKFPLYLNLAATYDALGQKDRAAKAYQQALQYNSGSIEAIAGLAEAKAAAGQTQEALELLRKGIAVRSTGGVKADENWYKRAVAIAYKAGDRQSVTASREWLKAYPNATSWHDALAIYQEFNELDEPRLLDILRLKRATNTMKMPDYVGLADIGVRKGYAGEAKAVLEEGFAANDIEKSNPTFAELYSVATQKTKGDRDSLPAAPEAGANAKQLVNFGDAWFGYGEYSKAVQFYQAALPKADAGADADLINLHIGMALARSGDKAGAVAALKKVGGKYADIAQYWLIYANSKA